MFSPVANPDQLSCCVAGCAYMCLGTLGSKVPTGMLDIKVCMDLCMYIDTYYYSVIPDSCSSAPYEKTNVTHT